jgi:ribonuclease HI
LNSACSKLTKAIQETIEKDVPTTCMGIKAKKWWTKELTKLRQEANRKGRKASKYQDWPEHHSHAERHEANKTFQKTLERTKRQHWWDWPEKAEDPDIWTAHKYTNAPVGDGGKSRIPVLKLTQSGQENIATTNEEKSKMLASSFFPAKPPNKSPTHFAYPKPICELTPISRDQIKRQLARLKPYKAPGPNGIPNIVLSKCADTIVNRLFYIFKAILDLGIYYEPWKLSTTVVLRKPGKPRYDTPKAYRPIALLNTMCKVLTALMAELMTFYTETHQLLPVHHFGGRPGRTTSDAVHLLVHKIKDSWRKRQVTAVLFLDIEGAFPNTVTDKLLHSMKKRGLPEKLVNFAGIMLSNRRTILRFDDHTSSKIALGNGIGQGDPLSMALYQYYNTDILEIPNSPQESAEAYIDDAIITATAKTFKEAHANLKDMMTRMGGMIEWSKSHNSSIEYSKLALIDFAHHGVKKHRPPLVLPSVTIEPSPSAKYIGIILDQNLNWAPQLAQVRGKGSKWAAQIRRLARPTWGLTPKGARKLFVSIAIPRTLYGVDIWCTPLHGKTARGSTKGSVNFVKKLATVQRAGALAVTGGFKTSPNDSLDAHVALLPTDLRVKKACHNAYTRMATLPQEHPLHALIKKSAKGRIKRHRSPLHTLASVFRKSLEDFEKIPPVRIHPRERGSRDIRLDIPLSKDESKRIDADTTEKIKVYSDGSAHDGKVGAAALLKREGNPDCTLKLHLGTTEQHTVYEAELIGMILGLYLIKTERRNKVRCALSVDNQVALVAIKSKMNKSGQHLAANLLKIAKQLQKQKGNSNYKLTICWSAGHVGIEGNEEADKLAKTAADGESSDKKDLPPCLHKKLGYSLSAARQAHNDKLKLRWAERWAKSPRYRRARYQDLLTPYSQKFLKYISSKDVTRKTASKIFQLRVGHALLNQYLFRFKKVESPQCPVCGHPEETAEHYLLQCLKYAHERWPILSRSNGRSSKFTKLLTNPKLLIPLANYIEATGRFDLETVQPLVSSTQ